MKRPKDEEVANGLSHLVGIVLSLLATVLLLSNLETSDVSIWIACCFYLATLVAVYFCSTFSHLSSDPQTQSLFRKLDQAFIYLLIVASYAPFSVAYLRDGWWWGLLGLMGVLAIVGFVSKLFLGHRIQKVSIWIYLLLGWMPALGGMPFSTQIPAACVGYIVAGGIVYSVGTVFLFNDKKFKYFHAVWHLFVIAGSIIHFIGIMKFVVS